MKKVVSILLIATLILGGTGMENIYAEEILENKEEANVNSLNENKEIDLKDEETEEVELEKVEEVELVRKSLEKQEKDEEFNRGEEKETSKEVVELKDVDKKVLEANGGYRKIRIYGYEVKDRDLTDRSKLLFTKELNDVKPGDIYTIDPSLLEFEDSDKYISLTNRIKKRSLHSGMEGQFESEEDAKKFIENANSINLYFEKIEEKEQKYKDEDKKEKVNFGKYEVYVDKNRLDIGSLEIDLGIDIDKKRTPYSNKDVYYELYYGTKASNIYWDKQDIKNGKLLPFKTGNKSTDEEGKLKIEDIRLDTKTGTIIRARFPQISDEILTFEFNSVFTAHIIKNDPDKGKNKNIDKGYTLNPAGYYPVNFSNNKYLKVDGVDVDTGKFDLRNLQVNYRSLPSHGLEIEKGREYKYTIYNKEDYSIYLSGAFSSDKENLSHISLNDIQTLRNKPLSLLIDIEGISAYTEVVIGPWVHTAYTINYIDEKGNILYSEASKNDLPLGSILQLKAGDNIYLLSSYNGPIKKVDKEYVVRGGDSKTEKVYEINTGDKEYILDEIDSKVDIPFRFIKNQKSTEVVYKAEEEILNTYEEILEEGESRTISAPSSYEHEGKKYVLDDDSEKTISYDSELSEVVFSYKEVKEDKEKRVIKVIYKSKERILNTYKEILEEGESRIISAPSSYEHEGKKYVLDDDSEKTISYDSELSEVVFSYKEVKEDKEKRIIKIVYKDEEEKILNTYEEILEEGESRIISAPSSYEHEGKKYILVGDSERLISYDSSPSQITYLYREVDEEKEKRIIKVVYKDEKEKILNTYEEILEEGESRTISAPRRYDYEGKKYVLVGDSEKQISYDSSPSQITYLYREVDEEKEKRIIKVVYKDEKEKILKIYDEILGEGESRTISAPRRYDYEGKKYVLVGDSEKQISYDSSPSQITYLYREVDEEKEKRIIKVVYKDEKEKILNTYEEILEEGESRTISAPRIYDYEGKKYSLVGNSEKQISYDDSPSQITYLYREMDEEKEKRIIKVVYKDEKEKILNIYEEILEEGESRTIKAPKIYNHAGKKYVLVGDSEKQISYGSSQSQITYIYREDKKDKEKRVIKIVYKDEEEKILNTYEEILEEGESRIISAPSSYEHEGKKYVLDDDSEKTISYDGELSEVVFSYKEVKDDKEKRIIKIVYKDEEEKILNTYEEILEEGESRTIRAPEIYEVLGQRYKLIGKSERLISYDMKEEEEVYNYKIIKPDNNYSDDNPETSDRGGFRDQDWLIMISALICLLIVFRKEKSL